MTDYPYAVTVITTDKAIGNMLASCIDPDVGGGETFDKGAKLRPIGSGDTVPTAWAAFSLLKATGYAIVSEFRDGGYPQSLLDKGITAEQIDAARAVITLEVGDRATLEGNGLAFIASLGLEILPES